MKKLISIVTICILLLNLNGCNDLDLYPLSEASDTNWFSDETEVEMAVNNIYHQSFWEGYAPRNFWFYTDDYVYRNYAVDWLDGTVTGQSGTVVDAWNYCYKCIARANTVLLHFDKSGDIPEAKLLKYEALARFARAANYAKLIFQWGDVPYYEGTIDIDEAFSMGRTNKDEILKKVYEDYDFAIEHLPLDYSSSEYYLATKGAALAFKARIALYMGDYALARDAAKTCIDLGIYELYPDYYELFTQTVKNSVETIFGVARSIALNEYWATTDWLPRNHGGICARNPSWDLFCSYLCSDGLPIDESPLYDPREPFKNRDPRCTATIVEFNRNWLGITFTPHPDSLTVMNYNTGKRMSNKDNRAVDQWTSFTGLVWAKRVDEDCLDKRSEGDNIVMRYADVLLMYAEAKIELNEIDQTVLDAMNQVRARAYGVDYTATSSYPAITTTNQTELRRILRVERRMEFAQENTIRFNDIMRWRLAEKVLNRPNFGLLDPAELRQKVVNPGLWFFPEITPIDEDGIPDLRPMYEKGLVKKLRDRFFDPAKHYLWPIPTSEIVINENMKQNPGY